MSSPKILVLGSTGSVGFPVSQALAKKNVPFRAAVHDLSKADKIKSLGNNIEVVKVDIWNPETLTPALEGIEKVFFMTPPGQTAASYGMADAMKKAGVKHIVKLSALGAEETGGKCIWSEEHRHVEDQINKNGTLLTSIRPSSFHSNLLHDVQSVKTGAPLFKSSGRAKQNWINNDDIGEVVAIALTENGHEGKIYNLTGPDTINWDDLAKLMSETFNKDVKHVPLTREQTREGAAKFMPTKEAVDGWCNIFAYFEEGGYDRSYPDTENILGRKPKSLKEYLVENKQTFQ